MAIYVKSSGDVQTDMDRRLWLSRESEACRDATHTLALQLRLLETVNRSGALVKQKGHLGAPGRTMIIRLFVASFVH